MLKNVSLFGVAIQNGHSYCILWQSSQWNCFISFFLAKINSENIIVLSHMVAHKSETFDHFTSDQIDWQIFFYEFIAKPNKYSHACVQHSKWSN